jgi:hypothetical protein
MTVDGVPSDADLVAEIHELSERIKSLSTDVKNKTAETRRRTNMLGWCLAGSVFVAVFVAVLMIRATTDNADAITQNNLKFCDLVADSASVRPPPSTPRGISLQRKASGLFDELGCPPSMVGK